MVEAVEYTALFGVLLTDDVEHAVGEIAQHDRVGDDRGGRRVEYYVVDPFKQFVYQPAHALGAEELRRLVGGGLAVEHEQVFRRLAYYVVQPGAAAQVIGDIGGVLVRQLAHCGGLPYVAVEERGLLSGQREGHREIGRGGGLALAGHGACHEYHAVAVLPAEPFRAGSDEADGVAEALRRVGIGYLDPGGLAAAPAPDVGQGADVAQVQHRLELVRALDGGPRQCGEDYYEERRRAAHGHALRELRLIGYVVNRLFGQPRFGDQRELRIADDEIRHLRIIAYRGLQHVVRGLRRAGEHVHRKEVRVADRLRGDGRGDLVEAEVLHYKVVEHVALEYVGEGVRELLREVDGVRRAVLRAHVGHVDGERRRGLIDGVEYAPRTEAEYRAEHDREYHRQKIQPLCRVEYVLTEIG